MANSRNSTSPNKGIHAGPNGQGSGDTPPSPPEGLQDRVERALDRIVARVFSFAAADSAGASAAAASPAISAAAIPPTAIPSTSIAGSRKDVNREEPIVIALACSGGLDSSVLLHLASAWSSARRIRLLVLHIHHGLSPNADAWLEHCEREAASLGCEFDSRQVEVPRDEGRSIEEAARVARYEALGALCREHGATLLLTAHHRDDQAETVMLQLLRGSGLPGLSGMAEFHARPELLEPGIAIGRPLLDVARAELEQAARERKIPHVVDESNEVLHYRRNALRHLVFPAIEAQVPGFSRQLARSAQHAQTAQALLEELAQIDLQSCRAADDDGILDVPALMRLPERRIANLLRHWMMLQGIRPPSTARLDAILGQLWEASADSQPFFDFGPLRLHVSGGRLEIHARRGQPPDGLLRLRWQGEGVIPVPDWNGRLHIEAAAGAGLDAAWLRTGELVVRARAGQERLKISASRPSRTLKNLFQESAIPAWRRPWLPLVYLDSSLVFAAGLGMDVRHLVKDGGLALRWQEGGENGERDSG